MRRKRKRTVTVAPLEPPKPVQPEPKPVQLSEPVQLSAEELAREVSLGDTVIRCPQTFGSGAAMPGSRMLRGQVTYIHPLRRYHTVEFPMKRGRVIRECFIGVRFHTLRGG